MARHKRTTTGLTILVALAAAFAGVLLGGDTVHAEGLTATGAQLFHQDVPGLDDSAETLDRFGVALASGDFNDDGYDDLAIGAPYENIGAATNAGAVTVLYGDGSGLYGSGFDQFWTVASLSGYLGGTTLTPTTDGRFGTALVSADVNADGYDDLVIAEHLPATALWSDFVDGIYVVYGSASGLTPVDFDWDAFYNDGCQTSGSTFHALTAGDFNGSGGMDIAYGGYEIHPNVNCPDTNHYGWKILHGSSSGISFGTGTWRSPLVFGACTVANQWEPFVLESGQFDGDNAAELVAGYPSCGTGGAAVLCMDEQCNYTTGGAEAWTQDSSGIVGGSEVGDAFGAALAAGDFNIDGCTDLAVGVPGEDAAATDQGAWQQIFGDCSGLTSSGNNLIGAIQVQASAFYSTALAAGNFDSDDSGDELASAAPYHNVTTTDDGLVDIRYSSATTNVWHQNVTGVPETNETDDQFGRVLTTGDFDGDGADDLAITAVFESINGQNDAGAVTILYGTSPTSLDTDGDGCPDVNEQQTDLGSETSGGLRDYTDPNDYYDVLGAGQSLTHDGVIDLANDILGVILHYAPTGAAPYDVRFDRGPTIGANHWERDAPDGVIDLANDILGVILQYQHNCV